MLDWFLRPSSMAPFPYGNLSNNHLAEMALSSGATNLDASTGVSIQRSFSSNAKLGGIVATQEWVKKTRFFHLI